MEEISREEARSEGLKRFFSGKPCVKGHLSERFVRNGQCVSCRSAYYDPVIMKAYNSAYRATNAEALKQYDKDRYVADPDKKRASSRRYYAANRDDCIESGKRWRRENVERVREARKQYRSANKDRIDAAGREFRRIHSKDIVARVREWRINNPGKKQAQHAARRARKLQALPSWFTELDQFIWQEAAHLVILRRDATGIDWAADHMIPLASKKACGLHVGSNCQVIPAYLNNWKHNKLILTKPDEWLKHL